MSKRTVCTLHYWNGHVARFSDRTTALRLARSESVLHCCTLGVSDATGLIAQFDRGVATPEFCHLDAEARGDDAGAAR